MFNLEHWRFEPWTGMDFSSHHDLDNNTIFPMQYVAVAFALGGPTARPPLSRHRVSLCLSLLCVSGIAGCLAVNPPPNLPYRNRGRGVAWGKLKLPSGGIAL